MNKLISGAALAAALAVASSANAADIAPVYKAPVIAAPVYDWTGFYLGGHAGGAWSKSDANWVIPSLLIDPYSIGGTESGFAGGVHAGYNWQARNWVFGIEGDWTWTNLSRSSSSGWTLLGGILAVPGSLTTLGQDVNWTASIRGRLGFLLNPQLLIYGTGGAAWADIDRNGSASLAFPGIGTYFAGTNFSQTKAGWVIGGGAEWMVTNNWLLRVEYLRYEFSNAETVTAVDPAIPADPSRFSWGDTTVQTVRAGLTYKFDYGKSPVMAKY